MQAGALTRNPVEQPSLLVLLDGIPAETVGFTLDREVSNAVVDGSSSGMIAATGSLTLLDSTDPVTARPLTPWSDPKTPSPGTKVEVSISIGGGTWTIFTGRVESNSGTVVGGLDQTQITDALPALNQQITTEASSSFYPLTTYPGDLTGGPGSGWATASPSTDFPLLDGIKRILDPLGVNTDDDPGGPWVPLPPATPAPNPAPTGRSTDGTGNQKWLLRVPATSGEAAEVGTLAFTGGNGMAGPDGHSWCFRNAGYVDTAPSGFYKTLASGYECAGTVDKDHGFTLCADFHLPTVGGGFPASCEVRVHDGATFAAIARLWVDFAAVFDGKPGTVKATVQGAEATAPITAEMRLGWEPGLFWLWQTPDGRVGLQAPSGEKEVRNIGPGGAWNSTHSGGALSGGPIARTSVGQWVPPGGRPVVQINTSGGFSGWTPVSGVALSDGGRNKYVPNFPNENTTASGGDIGTPPPDTYVPTGPPTVPPFVPGVQTPPLDIAFPAAVKWPQIKALPGLDDMTGLDVIKNLSESLIWPAWYDEFGKLIVVSRDDFGSGAYRTLTSAESLVDLGWSESLAALRGQTTVRYREAVVQHADHAQVRLWQSPTVIQVGSGRPYTEVISPPNDDTDWGGVPTGSMADFGSLSAAQQGNPTGHWVGGSEPDGTALSPGSVLGTVTKVSPRKWRLDITCPGYSGPIAVVLPSAQATVQGKAYANANAPVVRGHEVITWTSKEANAVDDGVIGADPLSHEAGWMLQKAADAQTLADWIAAAFAAGKGAVVERVEILLDPRVQIGDPVRLEDSARSGVFVQGVVTGVHYSITGGEWTQTLSLRVSSAGLLT